MNLFDNNKSFRKVSEIEIPDVFNKRLVTGIQKVDRVIGEGFLPGSIFTLTGSPGAGKTTFMLQVLEELAKREFNVGYASGEECAELLSMTCNRINVKNVCVANMTHIDDVLKATKDLDMLVIDSFNSIISDKKSQREHEKYCIQELCKASKKHECTIGIILHITKSGAFKGSTIIPHAVDTVMQLHRDMVDGQPDNYISFAVTKNRFGPTGEAQLLMTAAGYDWDAAPPAIDPANQVAPKSERKKEEMKKLLAAKKLDLKKASDLLEGNVQRANYLLWQLVSAGKLKKLGRGQTATWEVNK